MTLGITWDRRRLFTGFRVNTTGLALSRMLWIGYAVDVTILTLLGMDVFVTVILFIYVRLRLSTCH